MTNCDFLILESITQLKILIENKLKTHLKRTLISYKFHGTLTNGLNMSSTDD